MFVRYMKIHKNIHHEMQRINISMFAEQLPFLGNRSIIPHEGKEQL